MTIPSRILAKSPKASLVTLLLNVFRAVEAEEGCCASLPRMRAPHPVGSQPFLPEGLAAPVQRVTRPAANTVRAKSSSDVA